MLITPGCSYSKKRFEQENCPSHVCSLSRSSSLSPRVLEAPAAALPPAQPTSSPQSTLIFITLLSCLKFCLRKASRAKPSSSTTHTSAVSAPPILKRTFQCVLHTVHLSTSPYSFPSLCIFVETISDHPLQLLT